MQIANCKLQNEKTGIGLFLSNLAFKRGIYRSCFPATNPWPEGKLFHRSVIPANLAYMIKSIPHFAFCILHFAFSNLRRGDAAY